MVIHTNKGALRAGETHNVVQLTFLAAGQIEIITKQNNKNIHHIYKGCQKIEIPKEIPHYFIFLEDSIMVEIEEKNMTTKYYPKYRKIVEGSM